MTVSAALDAMVESRPGLPLDPVLQLARGEFRLIGLVTWTGGGEDPIAAQNPRRVMLMIVPAIGVGEWAVGPAGAPVTVPATLVNAPQPMVLHCRDYPGAVQGAWVGTGMVGTQVSVWEYQILY